MRRYLRKTVEIVRIPLGLHMACSRMGDRMQTASVVENLFHSFPSFIFVSLWGEGWKGEASCFESVSLVSSLISRKLRTSRWAAAVYQPNSTFKFPGFLVFRYSGKYVYVYGIFVLYHSRRCMCRYLRKAVEIVHISGGLHQCFTTWQACSRMGDRLQTSHSLVLFLFISFCVFLGWEGREGETSASRRVV